MWHENDEDRRHRDEGLAALATEQGGAVSRAQLRGLGFSAREVDYRVQRSRLHRVHRGVYAVGHRTLTPHGRLVAAVLACGPGAVVSHRSAADLHGLLSSSSARHEVTTATHRRPPGVRTHRCVLRDEDVTTVDGVPVTTVARTLLDLAGAVPGRLLERAIDQAEVLRVLDLRAVDAVLARGHGRSTATLRNALAHHRPGAARTQSPLEDRLLALVRRERLPPPLVNTRVAGLRVDLHWPAQRLVVEADGAAFHHTRAGFEQDRLRDAALQIAGHRVLRVTHAELHRDPVAVAGRIRALLGH